MNFYELRRKLEESQDIEELRKLAVNYLLVLDSMFCESMTDTFCVEVRWGDGAWDSIESGTKDYCIGFATHASEDGVATRVMCGNFQIWPEFGGD